MNLSLTLWVALALACALILFEAGGALLQAILFAYGVVL